MTDSKKKNTAGKVPATKIEPPTTIKLTKTQRELFVTKRAAGNKSLNIIADEFNKQVGENLGKLIDTFAEELGIDIAGEDWDFSPTTLQFEKREKK